MSEYLKNPAKLLGKVIDAPDVVEYQKGLDPKAKVKKQDGQKMWWSKPAGMEIQSEMTESRITSVALYADGVERYKQYAGAIPRGLSFKQSRTEVRKLMKVKPNFSGDGSEPYDTWDTDEYRLIVNYDDSGNIATVSLTGDF